MVQNPLVPRGCSLLICGSIKKHWRGKELSLLRTIGSNGELGACGAANTLCESISSDFICGLSLEEGRIMYQIDEGSILPLSPSLAAEDFKMSCFHDVICFSP